MARIRTVKPEFFLHEELYDLEAETGLPVRLAFIGLWCQCDREGRFKWRPRTLGAQILPFDNVDFSRVLHALTTRGFVRCYASNGAEYGLIPTFATHQVLNNRESDSVLPPPDANPCGDTSSTRAPRVPHASTTRGQVCAVEGKGREGKGKEGKGRRESARATAVPFGSADVLPTGESMATEVVAACDRWLEFLGATADRRVSADTVRSQLLEFRRQGREWSELPQVVAACIQGDKRQLFWDADRGPPKRGRSKPNDGIVF